MENENITSQPLPGDTHVESADGGEAVNDKTAQDAISLSKLKAELGKDFKDVDTALKSIKDTYSYVGKAGQIEKELKDVKSIPSTAANQDSNAEVVNRLKKLEEDLWYERNPQYKNFKSVISETGKLPEEVVSNPAFKDLFTKVQGFEETQKLKTVLETNPRLASSSDKFSKAVEAVNKGQKANAADLATQAVMEAYKME